MNVLLPPEARGASVYVPCKCGDAGFVWNEWMQKVIRCPDCKKRTLRYDPNGLRQISAAEKRRRKRALALVMAKAVLSTGVRISRLDPEFVPTNRIMERWQAGTGGGLPRTDEDWNDLVEAAIEQQDVFSAPPSRPPPLDDPTQIEVDQIIQHAPPEIRVFTREWWCSDLPCKTMEQQRGLRHDEIYVELHAVLRYYRFRFERSGHADLVAMVRALP